ncbi:MAG: phosphatidylserine/phosphatidylglycerophosphate/cardiolipin synthase family protein [Pseudomonadales bacterium]
MIDSAERSVWATITFMWATFKMPDDNGTALSVFERAARRGIDVRLIFWRPEDDNEIHRRNAFWGSTEHFELLAKQYPNINIRWDRAAPGYCQHQKSWLIDADSDWATSFVGGINLNPNSLVPPGHDYSNSGSELQNHDVYVELRGPSVADVHHNFVQRWNEASERADHTGRFGERAQEDLLFPNRAPDSCGTALVQIQRTIRNGLYENGHAPVDGQRFDITEGERTNFDQYCAAIDAAERTIYIENQYIEVAPIVSALKDALSRDVEVVVVLPVTPDYSLRAVDMTDERIAFLALRSTLSEHENFTLCGLATDDGDGGRVPVYVHSKLMIIDGEFATVGSCNLHQYSLYGNGELNAAIQDAGVAMSVMKELFQEHIGVDVFEFDDLGAIEAFKSVAMQNRQLSNRGISSWQGLAFEMDMSTYGERDQLATK